MRIRSAFGARGPEDGLASVHSKLHRGSSDRRFIDHASCGPVLPRSARSKLGSLPGLGRIGRDHRLRNRVAHRAQIATPVRESSISVQSPATRETIPGKNVRGAHGHLRVLWA